jgi:hypothetical protein
MLFAETITSGTITAAAKAAATMPTASGQLVNPLRVSVWDGPD